MAFDKDGERAVLPVDILDFSDNYIIQYSDSCECDGCY